MRIEPENSNVSIVLVGRLNASIFHPAWFLANGLISQNDFDNSVVDVIHRDLSMFNINDWLRVQVTQDRFLAETNEPLCIRLHDLVISTFREMLVHTPIFKMGINRRVHFSVGDEETRNSIGKMLAPQKAWGEWAESIEGKDKGKRGGMTSLSMSQVDLEDREGGHLQAKVEPSPLVKNRSGIFVEMNDHYEISDDEIASSIPMMGILEKQFDISIKRSEWVIDQIMALKEKV
jgi:hypothetical protein